MAADAYPRDRILRFAGATVLCHVADATAERCVERLFGGVLEQKVQAETAAHAAFDLSCLRGLWHVSRRSLLKTDEAVTIYTGPDPVTAADLFMADATHELAVHARGGLLFHAGLLAGEAGAALIPGAIGAGKSTLSAWLVQQGWAYLSDELAFVPDGDTRAHGLPRPLNLKAPWRRVLGVEEGPHPDIYSGEGFDLVPASLLAPPNAPPATATALPVRLVLFPERITGAEPEVEPLTPAQTGLALMRCLINARNLPEHGFHAVAALSRQTVAYRLRYDQVYQLEPWLHQLYAPLNPLT